MINLFSGNSLRQPNLMAYLWYYVLVHIFVQNGNLVDFPGKKKILRLKLNVSIKTLIMVNSTLMHLNMLLIIHVWYLIQIKFSTFNWHQLVATRHRNEGEVKLWRLPQCCGYLLCSSNTTHPTLTGKPLWM